MQEQCHCCDECSRPCSRVVGHACSMNGVWMHLCSALHAIKAPMEHVFLLREKEGASLSATQTSYDPTCCQLFCASAVLHNSLQWLHLCGYVDLEAVYVFHGMMHCYIDSFLQSYTFRSECRTDCEYLEYYICVILVSLAGLS